MPVCITSSFFIFLLAELRIVGELALLPLELAAASAEAAAEPLLEVATTMAMASDLGLSRFTKAPRGGEMELVLWKKNKKRSNIAVL
jgi:hypothetical protein